MRLLPTSAPGRVCSRGLVLDNGNEVYGVEPNQEMREAGEIFLRDYPKFHSINATAEATTLPDASIDFVMAGQAFHWFDTEQFQAECRRILKPSGWIVLVWNERRVQATEFSREYEAFIETWNTDFTDVTRRRWTEIDEGFDTFFGPGRWKTVTFDNPQTFTWELFAERVKSSSYMPPPSDERHTPMMNDLHALFHRYQQDGIVVFDQDTRAFWGRPGN